MRKVEFISLICGLLLVGFGVFFYRAYMLEFPVLPNQSVKSWHVEAKLSFEGTGEDVNIRMFLPRGARHYTIVDESFISHGFNFQTEIDERNNRKAQWIKKEPRSKEVLFYRGILYETRPASEPPPERPQRVRVPRFGSKAFEEKAISDPSYFLLRDVLGDIQAKIEEPDQEQMALAVFRMAAQPKQKMTRKFQDQVEGLNTIESTLVFILNHLGLPARVMNGVVLTDRARNIQPQRWIEIFHDNQWKFYDVETDELRRPNDRIAWWVGQERLYEVENGRNPVLSLAVKQHVENALTETIWRGDPTREAVYKISVFSLPVDIQVLFGILFLVPVGAVVVSFLRQMIGIHTFGTFMPVLVALAFRETQLFWGIILFTVIVGMGLTFRAYLDRLRLLMIPRLGAILTLVVITIYLLSLVAFHSGFYIGLSISMFPLVILAMLIERMAMSWEEFGMRSAMQSALGSLFTATIAYMIITSPIISHMIITFPELLLVTLAVHMLIGRYNGYKLTEYYRFRMIGRAKGQL